MVLAVLVLAACASKPPENPDARACLPPESSAMRDKDYNIRLAGYTHRADVFATCMTEHGYVLDANELDTRLTHFEQVKNANVMGGDPAWAMRIEEQVLRTTRNCGKGREAHSWPSTLARAERANRSRHPQNGALLLAPARPLHKGRGIGSLGSIGGAARHASLRIFLPAHP